MRCLIRYHCQICNLHKLHVTFERNGCGLINGSNSEISNGAVDIDVLAKFNRDVCFIHDLNLV